MRAINNNTLIDTRVDIICNVIQNAKRVRRIEYTRM